MDKRKPVIDALTDFKSVRDAMIHANDDEFIHHLKAFLRELETNMLCKDILEKLPAFDVESWWKRETATLKDYQKLESINMPEGKDDRLCALLDLAQSFGSTDPKQLNAEGFGRMFGKYKRSESYGLTTSLVLRPLAEEITRRLRDAAAMANPDVRELSGVPLNRIPNSNETAIFLSHKGVNKDIVRLYHKALQQIGFEPWIDEDEIVAGDTLHRALTSGMDHSCAAVFFITPDFKDERWLGREVELAVKRHLDFQPKFQIITLVFGDAQVPRLLSEYVYKKVINDLEGLREIVRALPIELGSPRWKENVIKNR